MSSQFVDGRVCERGCDFPDVNGILAPASDLDPGVFPGAAFYPIDKRYESSANSAFHSLQLELRKRYGHGLQFGSSFTYSHSVDDASDFSPPVASS